MKTLLNGFLTGLFLQLAIGPVFFLVLSIAIESDLLVAWAGVLGVVVVDYIYISLSILGIAKLIDHPKIKTIFGIISAVVIIAFGAFLLWNALQGVGSKVVSGHRTMSEAFVTCFLLTLSSPLTLFFWSSIFAAKAIEKNYGKKDIIVFGTGAGLSTLLFLGAAVTIVSIVNAALPEKLTLVFNIIVAAVMIGYGLIRLLSVVCKKTGESRAE